MNSLKISNYAEEKASYNGFGVRLIRNIARFNFGWFKSSNSQKEDNVSGNYSNQQRFGECTCSRDIISSCSLQLNHAAGNMNEAFQHEQKEELYFSFSAVKEQSREHVCSNSIPEVCTCESNEMAERLQHYFSSEILPADLTSSCNAKDQSENGTDLHQLENLKIGEESGIPNTLYSLESIPQTTLGFDFDKNQAVQASQASFHLNLSEEFCDNKSNETVLAEDISNGDGGASVSHAKKMEFVANDEPMICDAFDAFVQEHILNSSPKPITEDFQSCLSKFDYLANWLATQNSYDFPELSRFSPFQPYMQNIGSSCIFNEGNKGIDHFGYAINPYPSIFDENCMRTLPFHSSPSKNMVQQTSDLVLGWDRVLQEFEPQEDTSEFTEESCKRDKTEYDSIDQQNVQRRNNLQVNFSTTFDEASFITCEDTFQNENDNSSSVPNSENKTQEIFHFHNGNNSLSKTNLNMIASGASKITFPFSINQDCSQISQTTSRRSLETIIENGSIGTKDHGPPLPSISDGNNEFSSEFSHALEKNYPTNVAPPKILSQCCKRKSLKAKTEHSKGLTTKDYITGFAVREEAFNETPNDGTKNEITRCGKVDAEPSFRNYDGRSRRSTPTPTKKPRGRATSSEASGSKKRPQSKSRGTVNGVINGWKKHTISSTSRGRRRETAPDGAWRFLQEPPITFESSEESDTPVIDIQAFQKISRRRRVTVSEGRRNPKTGPSPRRCRSWDIESVIPFLQNLAEENRGSTRQAKSRRYDASSFCSSLSVEESLVSKRKRPRKPLALGDKYVKVDLEDYISFRSCFRKRHSIVLPRNDDFDLALQKIRNHLYTVVDGVIQVATLDDLTPERLRNAEALPPGKVRQSGKSDAQPKRSNPSRKPSCKMSA